MSQIGYNHFLSFKGRRPDVKRLVQVYRSINGDAEHRYSVKQNGLVVGHTKRMVMGQVRFKVSEAGRRRVLKTGVKNVHAYIVGYIAPKGAMGSSGHDGHRWPVQLKYDPKKGPYFTDRDGDPVGCAMAAILYPTGVGAAYVGYIEPGAA